MIETEDLCEIANVGARIAGRIAEHDRFARSRRHYAAENLKRRSLSGAIGTNQTEYLASLNIEIDATDRFNLTINFAQATHTNGSLRWERGRPVRIVIS